MMRVGIRHSPCGCGRAHCRGTATYWEAVAAPAHPACPLRHVGRRERGTAEVVSPTRRATLHRQHVTPLSSASARSQDQALSVGRLLATSNPFRRQTVAPNFEGVDMLDRLNARIAQALIASAIGLSGIGIASAAD